MGVVRKCIYCLQEDDHPKHEMIHPPAMSSVYAHYDCCAEVTNCEQCVPPVKTAKGKRGAAFLKHLRSGAA